MFKYEKRSSIRSSDEYRLIFLDVWDISYSYIDPGLSDFLTAIR